LLLLAMATPATAQVLPALYNVAGVAADDVLDVRAAYEAGAEIVDTLPPGCNRY
jgi:hypothetical protein